MNVFDGLRGYILFVFALAAITVMIVQRRDFKMARLLIIFAIVLMGFPGIQAVKFSRDTVELNRIRTQPQVQATLVPVLTAKLNQVQADAPIAPSPVAAPATGSSASGATSTPPTATATGTPASTGTVATAPAPAAPPPTESSRQREIATIAKQLQGNGAPLPAASHAALAKAYVVLGQPQKAQANVDAALKLNPNIKINAAVLHAAKVGSNQ